MSSSNGKVLLDSNNKKEGPTRQIEDLVRTKNSVRTF